MVNWAEKQLFNWFNGHKKTFNYYLNLFVKSLTYLQTPNTIKFNLKHYKIKIKRLNLPFRRTKNLEDELLKPPKSIWEEDEEEDGMTLQKSLCLP